LHRAASIFELSDGENQPACALTALRLVKEEDRPVTTEPCVRRFDRQDPQRLRP
jgi:hypothetical protein